MTGTPNKTILIEEKLYKECSSCTNLLLLDENFELKSKKNANIYRSICKSCRKEQNKKYLYKDTLRLKFQTFLLKSIKGKDRGDLTIEYLFELWNKQGGLCAISGIPMTHKILQNKRTLTNVSIDRIDNTKGYSKDNIQLVCYTVNLMKNWMTMEELLFFCENILIKNTTILN